MPTALVIHYIYLKGQHRNKHIAADMVAQILNKHSLIVASHICDEYAKLRHKVPGCKIIFDPYIIDKLKEIDGSSA